MRETLKIESIEEVPFHLQSLRILSKTVGWGVFHFLDFFYFLLMQFWEKNIHFIMHELQLFISFNKLHRGKDQGYLYLQFASKALSFFSLRRDEGNSTIKFLLQENNR